MLIICVLFQVTEVVIMFDHEKGRSRGMLNLLYSDLLDILSFVGFKKREEKKEKLFRCFTFWVIRTNSDYCYGKRLYMIV